MTKKEILQRLQEIVDTINNAQSDINKGTVKDLTSMDQEVATICDHILKLSPEDASDIQPAMADMITKLEKLATSLQDFQNQFDHN